MVPTAGAVVAYVEVPGLRGRVVRYGWRVRRDGLIPANVDHDRAGHAERRALLSVLPGFT